MEGQMRQGLPCEVEFGSFSQKQIKKLSVVLIQSPLTFNSLNHPLPGGVYDPALGPFDNFSVCTTCHLRQIKCPGHFGHLELPMPVLNPMFIKSIISVMKMICLECHKILIPDMAKTMFKAQMRLLSNGYIVEAQEVSNFVHLDYKETLFLDEEKLDKFVLTTLQNGSAKTFEYKGENDYRNTFLRNVLAQISKNKTCLFCRAAVKKVSSVAEKIFIPAKLETAPKFSKTKKISSTSNFEQILPKRIKMHLTEVYRNEKDFLDMLLPILKSSEDDNPINCLFLDLVLVTPTKSRPINIVDGTISEHPQNSIYKQILLTCGVMRALIGQAKNENLNDETISTLNALQGKSNEEKLKNCYNELQMHVSSLLDTEVLKQRNPTGLGLKQVIEKKEGIIRMNMMGKRVNFAARTVITPDPNLNVDEIGIPEAFAKKLTYPVPITAWNVVELRKLVYNGPMVHPGAVYIENEDGTSLKLDPYDLVQREGIAKRLLTPGDVHGIKILHRHLQNGDILLLNRQPTLHRPSIMAHKARVLQGEKTFRLHYANCKSYNADFDGDEMNAHFPQNEVARSEGYNIVSASKQYLVPKDGTPLSGLIQDHVVSGVRLTIRGKFFTREEYMQLVFQGLSYLQGDIKILPPAIIKPQKLWSGKQIVSTIIINVIKSKCINLTSKSKVPENAWKGGSSLMSEAEVVIRQGELLCGILDKMHYGSTPYSLVHCVYELYGGEIATRLLSSFAKLFTAFLQYEGFTLGVEDILVVEKADNKRTKLVKKARKIGNDVVLKTIDVNDGDVQKALSSSFKDPMFRAILDHQYKKSLDVFTNNINKTCLPAGLLKPFPANNLQLMVQSGAKGSTVNTMQISCLLGQIELEGKRPPLMASGRSLPSFPPFETSPRAGGFVDGRFMTGIKPQEFFFHCMAGREGLIDTAVKTSRSGYLQRCLVKHLEGLTVHYDMTVRDSDGSVIQFLYGEDGLEVTKSQFLNKRQLPFLAENLVAAHDSEIVESLKCDTTHKIRSLAKSIRKYNKKHSENQRSSPFLNFCREQSCDINGFDSSSGRSKAAIYLVDKWVEMSDEEKRIYTKKIKKRPDPVVSKFQADRHFGAITEKLDSIIDEYLKTTNSQVDGDLLKEMVYLKSQTSLCSPGEPVGLLAAQSIGEPSTQMTLNTFHFAGRGEMNVTLGIPRLREVLMVASKNIKTPSMEIPFKKDIPNIEQKVEKLRKSLTKITMADVLERAEITEKIETSSNSSMMIYVIKMYFLPEEAFSEKTHLKSSQIAKFVEKKFLKTFVSYVMMKKKQLKELIASEAEGKNRDADEDVDDPKATKKRGADNDYQSSDDEPENDDDDATTQRRRQRQNEEQQYSDEDDEEEKEETRIENESLHENEEPEDANTSIRKSIIAHDNILEYKCDVNHKWCEVKIGFPVSSEKLDLAGKLKEFAAISVITQVPGIKRAFISTRNDGVSVLTTEGKNLREMYYHMDILDLNKLYTNDINAVAEKYGIEAASKAIVKEVQSVFNVYGITVDFRHLSLVADYMTFYGYYRPLSRVGFEGNSSPLQQMSFEAPLGFLRSAITRAQKDNLKSPSSRLMLGQPVLAGTGSFHLLHCFKI